MDFSKYLSMAFDYLQWFSGAVERTVGASIMGGWLAVLAFAAVVTVLFLVTSLFSTRQSGD
jgi:Fe2+ transport system protein B